MLRAELLLYVTSLISSPFSFFPHSLRYLVQQHVDLLHALQERVLSWPRQGILGDIFLKLTNDEVCYRPLWTLLLWFMMLCWWPTGGPRYLAADGLCCEAVARVRPFSQPPFSRVPVQGSPSVVVLGWSGSPRARPTWRHAATQHSPIINAQDLDLAAGATHEPWQLVCLYS